MLIHRAETGVTVSHRTPLPAALLAPDLWPALADLAGVRPQALRLFLPTGDPIRPDAVDDAREMEELARKVEREGGDEVYAFDLDAIAGHEGDGRERDLLIDPPEEAEFPVLPAYAPTPQKPSSFLPTAQIHHAHISSLLTQQHTQHRALTLAYSTLSSHISNLSSALAAFSPLATRELARQATLLRDHKLSMTIMSRVRVHPEVRRMKEGKWQKGKETLGDCVRGDAMRLVEEGCRTLHGDLVARWTRVLESRDALLDGADRVRAAAELLQPREAEECYHRATRSLTRLQELVSDNSDDEPQTEEEDVQRSQLMSELRTLDRSLRTELHTMTTLKNNSTLSLLTALRTISQLQSAISHLPPVLKQLEAQLRASSAGNSNRPSAGPGVANFAHVERVRKGLWVYGATIVEVVRRKEFARFFSSRARALSELMHKMTAREHKRRQTFRAECSGQLPFEVRGLGSDQAVPTVEVTTLGTEVGEWSLERSDVLSLMDLVREMERIPYPLEDSVYYTRELEVSGEKLREHPATEARVALEKMVERMDALEEGFDRMAERSLLSVSWGPQSKQRTTSDVSGYREALDELRELKRAKSEATERSHVEQDALQAEVTRLRAELARTKDDCAVHASRAESLDNEFRSIRALADSDKSVRQTLERRHHELRADLAHKGQQLEQALAEGTAQTEEMEALRKELLHAREEFERVRALQEESASEAGRLLRAQAEMLHELEEARKRGEDLEKGIEDARQEGQKASEALAEADKEKERLLRAQASEADRRLRDQRAEADGDRAVLERHYYELTAQVERLDTELKEVRGAGEVMKADLEEATERLARAGEEEGVWEDERRVTREENERLERELEGLRERTAEREVLLGELVRVAAAFRDTSARLLVSVQASNVVTKMANGELGGGTPPKPVPQQQQQQKPIDPSDPVTALAVLREFDLSAFSDAVLKTGSTIRRWQKNTREYRERAKGRISYRNFAKGDLALFLPTRNNVAKPWAAFNVGFPHYFLQQTPALTEMLNGRDWLVARITAIREFVADSKDPATNPYSLIDGLKFHMLDVELVNLTAPDPAARRHKNPSASPSKGFDGNASVTADSMMASIVALSSPIKPAVAEDTPMTPTPSTSARPLRTLATSLLTSALPQPFSPIATPTLAEQEPIPSPFSPPASSPDPANNEPSASSPPLPTVPETSSSSPSSIPFATPQLPVPSSTQHTLLEEADIIRPPSAMSHTRSAKSTPSRGSFSSSRGRPPLLGGTSTSSPSNKAAPTTALMRTSTPNEPPPTPSPADSLGAGLDSVRRSTPSHSPSTTTAPTNPFATIASNLGATFSRKRTASVVASQGVAAPERRDSPNSAADLLKRFHGS